jgi:hypothetical protein
MRVALDVSDGEAREMGRWRVGLADRALLAPLPGLPEPRRHCASRVSAFGDDRSRKAARSAASGGRDAPRIASAEGLGALPLGALQAASTQKDRRGCAARRPRCFFGS